MATTVQTQTHTKADATTTSSLPLLVEGELPLPVPPICAEQALHYMEKANWNHQDDNDNDFNSAATPETPWKTSEGEFLGTSLEGMINPYKNLEHLQTLVKGGCLFSFACRHRLSPYEAEMVDAIINLSAFDKEVEENYVPHFDSAKSYLQTNHDGNNTNNNQNNENENNTREETPQTTGPPVVSLDGNSLFGLDVLGAPPANHPSPAASPPPPDNPKEPPYSFLLARTAYLLTGVDLDTTLRGDPGVQLLSSPAYHQACQPRGTTVWTDVENMAPDNFRITKPIIPYVYNLTVQFRVSAIDDAVVLRRLGRHVGTRVDAALLLERTKRSTPPQEDATKKCKSVLLYTNLGLGVVLVNHLTVVLQRGLPDPVERLIHYLPNKFQSWGLGETCETAWKTRAYLQQWTAAASLQDQGYNEEDDFVDAQQSFEEEEEKEKEEP